MLFEDKKFVGLKLRQARVAMQLSQEQLAEKIGISEKHISNIERGQNYPSLDTFLRMCLVLNLSLEYFGISVKDSTNKDREILLKKVYSASDSRLKSYLTILDATDMVIDGEN